MRQELVEIAEVVLEEAGGAAGFAGDRPAAEGARPVADEHLVGGSEELLAKVGDRYAAR